MWLRPVPTETSGSEAPMVDRHIAVVGFLTLAAMFAFGKALSMIIVP